MNAPPAVFPRTGQRRVPWLTLAIISAVAAAAAHLWSKGDLPLLTGVEDGLRVSDLAHQHLRGLLTSLPLTRNPFMAASIVASLALTLGVYEYLAGAFRAAVVAIIGAVIGPAGLAMTIGVGVMAGVSSADRALGTVDYGASCLVAAAAGALAATVRWRPLATGLAVFTLAGLLLHHQIADIMHIWAFPAGYGAARALRRVRPGWPVDLHVRAARVPPPARVRRILGGAAGVAVVTVAALSPLSMATAAATLGATPAGVSAPRVVEEFYPSPALHSPRRVLVVLPAGYGDNANQTYPAVVLLHGGGGAPPEAWLGLGLAGALSQSGLPPAVVLLPDGAGPHVQESWYLDLPSQDVGRSVAEDLRDWATPRYRLTRGWSYGGLSSGAYGAAVLAERDSPGRRVAGLCALSGWFGTAGPGLSALPAATRRAAEPLARTRYAPERIFLASGTGDTVTGTESARYASALREQGRQVRVRQYPGAHDTSVWMAALPDCLSVLLRSP